MKKVLFPALTALLVLSACSATDADLTGDDASSSSSVEAMMDESSSVEAMMDESSSSDEAMLDESSSSEEMDDASASSVDAM